MSDIRGTLFNITRNVTKTSGDLIKTTKLTVNLTSEQEHLKNLYIEIGKKVHEIYLYGGTLGKFFDEKYHELEACEVKINALKEQINQIKGTRECPKCKKTVDRTAEFCSKCGTRMDGIPVSDASESAASAPAPASAYASAPAPASAYTSAYASAPEPASVSTAAIPDPWPEIPAPLPETTPAPAAIPNTPPAKRICNVCGAANDPDTKFCLSCGRIL